MTTNLIRALVVLCLAVLLGGCSSSGIFKVGYGIEPLPTRRVSPEPPPIAANLFIVTAEEFQEGRPTTDKARRVRRANSGRGRVETIGKLKVGVWNGHKYGYSWVKEPRRYKKRFYKKREYRHRDLNLICVRLRSGELKGHEVCTDSNPYNAQYFECKKPTVMIRGTIYWWRCWKLIGYKPPITWKGS